jgi:hypothetical protein
MKYAERQLVSADDGSCDRGSARRSVLVRNGKKEIIHVAGAKHWGGVGAEREYTGAHIIAYPVAGELCQDKHLESGKMNGAKWAGIAEAMFAHLGTRFPIELISLKHTLLLDEPGELDGPPPPAPSVPTKKPPRIDSDKIYRIFHDDDGTCQLIEVRIIRQVGGKITYMLSGGGERERRTKDIIADGGAGTVEGAVAAYLATFEERAAEATTRLQRSAQNFAYADDMLSEARQRIEAMLGEMGGQDR